MKGICFLLSFFFCVSVFAQNIEKRYFENNPTRGGDVVIKTATDRVEGGQVFKTFEIECIEDGMYYLDAWICMPVIKESCPEYKIAVNGLLSDYTFKSKQASWQSIALTDVKGSAATVRLKKGDNSISVIGELPLVPAVEFIKFSMNATNRGISDASYREFIEKIENKTMNDDLGINGKEIRITPISDHDNSVSPRGTGGEIYDYAINMQATYTFNQYYYFSGGSTVTVTIASGASNHNFIIELFQRQEPLTPYYSSTRQISGFGTATMDVFTTTGYIVRVRSGSLGVATTADITINGVSFPNSVVAGNGINLTSYNSGTASFYVSHVKSSGQPWLFLIDGPSYPGHVVAHGEYGTSSSGYYWGNGALVTTSHSIKCASVSAYSSYTPSFVCDVYANLPPVTSYEILDEWPWLATSTAFTSGPATYNYFSYGYAAGLYEPEVITSLSKADSYFGFGYTRTGADANNAAIALWTNPSTGAITHASVRKNSTMPNPHGFEWESKCGPAARIMHTKEALYGGLLQGLYGVITYYYKPINGTVNYSAEVNLDENIEAISMRSSNVQKSMFVRYESHFSQPELNQMEVLKGLLPDIVKIDFDAKYLRWKKTWSEPGIALSNNLHDYAKSEEYASLLNYCNQFGYAIWPLIFEKINENSFLSIALLEDLTFPKYREIYDNIYEHFASKVEVGKPIPSSMTMYTDYCKQLLEQENENIRQAVQGISMSVNELNKKNIISINNVEILLNLYSENETLAQVKIYNLFGSITFEAGYSIPKGGQTVVISTSTFIKGIYVIQVTIGGKIITQKFNI